MNVRIETADPSAPGGWSDHGRSALWAYLDIRQVDPVTESRIKVLLATDGQYTGTTERLTLVRSAP